MTLRTGTLDYLTPRQTGRILPLNWGHVRGGTSVPMDEIWVGRESAEQMAVPKKSLAPDELNRSSRWPGFGRRDEGLQFRLRRPPRRPSRAHPGFCFCWRKNRSSKHRKRSSPVGSMVSGSSAEVLQRELRPKSPLALSWTTWIPWPRPTADRKRSRTPVPPRDEISFSNFVGNQFGKIVRRTLWAYISVAIRACLRLTGLSVCASIAARHFCYLTSVH